MCKDFYFSFKYCFPEGPHKGAGFIQREEEERMRYEEKEEGIAGQETMLSHILILVLSLSALSVNQPYGCVSLMRQFAGG